MPETATPDVKLVSANPLADKVYTTEKAGISRRTHDEHFKLYEGYAKKTNEIRKALAEMELDPSKANQIYSQMRALKVDYTFENTSGDSVYFRAVHSIRPLQAAKEFQLIQCFCFDDQSLGPRETRELPVYFALSPRFPSNVDEIILSYTLFPRHTDGGSGPFGAQSLGDLYFLWSLERTAVAFDVRTIAGKEWYLWGAELIIDHQQPNGSWNDRYAGVVDTSFALLFLKRSNLVRDLTNKLVQVQPKP